jgi:hypothetical protein
MSGLLSVLMIQLGLAGYSWNPLERSPQPATEHLNSSFDIVDKPPRRRR